MSLGTILLIILVLLLIGALPSWPYSAQWGPYPAGGLGIVIAGPSRFLHASTSRSTQISPSV